MKMLKKLALVSAVSMISAGVFAMEAMDEETMSATTGQDGITIKIIPGAFTDATAIATATAAGYGPGVAVQQLGYASGYKGLSIGEVRIHDDDGVGALGSATANSGAIVIGGGYDINGNGNYTDAGDIAVADDRTNVFTNEAKSIEIKIDSVGDSDGSGGGAGGAMLNVSITTPTLRIQTGAIYVANSDAAASNLGYDENGDSITATTDDTDGTDAVGKVKILDGMGLTMGSATINVQLGNEAQGAMIKLDTVISGGLIIDNVGLIDAGGTAAPALGQPVTTGGKIYIGQMKINDNGGSGNLTVKVNVDVGAANTSVLTQASRDAIIADASGGAFANEAAAVAAGALGAPVIAAVNSNQTQIQNGYNGLVIGLEQVGGVNGMDIAMNDLRLGDSSAATMGDVQILGLNINGTNVVIMGH